MYIKNVQHSLNNGFAFRSTPPFHCHFIIHPVLFILCSSMWKELFSSFHPSCIYDYLPIEPLLYCVWEHVQSVWVIYSENASSSPFYVIYFMPAWLGCDMLCWHFILSSGTCVMCRHFFSSLRMVYFTTFVHNSPRLPLYKYQGETGSIQFVTMIVMSLYECGNTRESLQDRHLR
jgi:hypothetical protein